MINTMKKINVLQITHDLRIGGLQEVVVNICRSIDKSRFNVKVLCLRDKGPLSTKIEKLGIDVIEIEKRPGKVDYFAFTKVAKIIKDNNIDVVHTHNTQPFVDGTLGALLAGRKLIVHTDHARDFPDKYRYMFAEWLMSQFAYKVVGVSAHTCENLRKYEHISSKKLQVIENGVDGDIYRKDIDYKKKCAELGISPDDLVIGLGVRLVEQKGISYLLHAMNKLISDYPNIVLLIAGEGDQRRALEEMSVDLKLGKHVKFLGPRMDIDEILKVIDIYVLPSFWEGLPMVLLEAMASGCPIVATNVGGVGKAIEHGVNGTLIPPRDSDAIYLAIKELIDNPELRDAYAESGQKIFDKKFSSKGMVDKYQDIFISGFTEKNV